MRTALALLFAWFLVPAVAADPVAAALKAGGVAVVMRHATAPGTYDPEGFRLEDCSTQRNLSEEGRAEARRIGERFRQLGLEPGEVLTSQWCRCRETARLAFGAAADWPALNSFARDRAGEERQLAEIRARILALKAGQRPLVLVTHQVVVTALSGVFPQSGEAVVLAPGTEDGKPVLRVVGSIRPPAQ